MNQILQDYYHRFLVEKKPNFEKFFTQMSVAEYKQKLPFLFEIDSFCFRLLIARLKNQKICIYSDYDTDAVTATATMYWGLIYLGFSKENLSFYAPDRFTEGYGMNVEAVLKLAKTNDLIISVDCGINSTAEAEAAKNTSCDLIITDHHHLNSALPDCLAVVNPQVAKYYQENKVDYKNSQNLLSQLPENYKKKSLAWFLELKDAREDFKSTENLLSQSTTGVGVAWFSLVWLGYFLEEIGFKNGL